jgi:hypothetical protein
VVATGLQRTLTTQAEHLGHTPTCKVGCYFMPHDAHFAVHLACQNVKGCRQQQPRDVIFPRLLKLISSLALPTVIAGGRQQSPPNYHNSPRQTGDIIRQARGRTSPAGGQPSAVTSPRNVVGMSSVTRRSGVCRGDNCLRQHGHSCTSSTARRSLHVHTVPAFSASCCCCLATVSRVCHQGTAQR